MNKQPHKDARLLLEHRVEIDSMSQPINEVLPRLAKILRHLRKAHQELHDIEVSRNHMEKHNWTDLHSVVRVAQLDITKARHRIDGQVLRLVRGRANDIENLIRKKKLFKQLNKHTGGAK